MPADDDDHLGLQFQYDTVDLGGSKPHHRVRAFAAGGAVKVGDLLWTSKEVSNIGVAADQQRRGVATGMWQEAHRLAAENARVPQPKHSSDRTAAGDAWARSVGGRLPRRRQG
jgi:hypothetical protein